MSSNKPGKKFIEVKAQIPTFLAAMIPVEEMGKTWGVSRATAFRWIEKYRKEMMYEQGKTSSIALSILEGKKRVLDETIQNFMKTVQSSKKEGSKVSPTQLADMAAKTMSVYEQFEKTANRFGFIEPETTKQEHSGLPTKIEVFIPEDIRKKAEEQLKTHSSEYNKKTETKNDGEKSQV